MYSTIHSLVRLVTLRELHGTCVIEVEGELDLVSGYDLRNALTTALHTTTGTITLDLSRVTAVDDQGRASLEWCSAFAAESHRVLAWTGCINPFLRDLSAAAP